MQHLSGLHITGGRYFYYDSAKSHIRRTKKITMVGEGESPQQESVFNGGGIRKAENWCSR